VAGAALLPQPGGISNSVTPRISPVAPCPEMRLTEGTGPAYWLFGTCAPGAAHAEIGSASRLRGVDGDYEATTAELERLEAEAQIGHGPKSKP
jgi:hypothetical protein